VRRYPISYVMLSAPGRREVRIVGLDRAFVRRRASW
jgi:hypothetical protein